MSQLNEDVVQIVQEGLRVLENEVYYRKNWPLKRDLPPSSWFSRLLVSWGIMVDQPTPCIESLEAEIADYEAALEAVRKGDFTPAILLVRLLSYEIRYLGHGERIPKSSPLVAQLHASELQQLLGL